MNETTLTQINETTLTQINETTLTQMNNTIDATTQVDVTTQEITVKAIKAEILSYLESDELFREWLLEYNNNEKIGQAGSGGRCPLFNYLDERTSEQVKLRHVGICYLTCFLTEELNTDIFPNIVLPLWAQRFIYRLDKKYKSEQVTVQNCLSILNNKKPAGSIY